MSSQENFYTEPDISETLPDQQMKETLAGAVAEIETEAEHVCKQGETALDSLSQETRQETASRLRLVHEKIKQTVDQYKEAVYMYARLVLFSGLVLVVPGEKGQDHRSLAQRIAAAKSDIGTMGITQEQRNAYIPGVNDLLQRNIQPVSYEITAGGPRGDGVLKTLVYGRNIEWAERVIPHREDAWRMYLGMPQKHNTFGISEYRPTRSKDDVYYYRINGFLEKKFGESSNVISAAGEIRTYIRLIQEYEPHKYLDSDSTVEVMGDYLRGRGVFPTKSEEIC
ncbi:MAG: hypothetical protein HY006_03970 [Candidatus Sungbacteria bacterium]|nr:hypothetical protein [Candidatus Sungbacteria bacterium]